MNEYRLTRNEPFLNPNCFGPTWRPRAGITSKPRVRRGDALMQEMFHDTAGFTSELWKPDYPAEDLEPDLDDLLPDWADYTPTSRIIGLPSTEVNQPGLGS